MRSLPTAPVLAAALLACGCQAHRELRFVSEPPGATVRLDDEVVGRAPLRVPYQHYGTRRFSFYLDGYLAQSEVRKVNPPWYARFPLDYVSDLLLGWAWSDVRDVRIKLQPETGRMDPVDVEGLLHRAETLRRAGPTGPRRTAPPDAPPARSE